jgi:hypothetical protein
MRLRGSYLSRFILFGDIMIVTSVDLVERVQFNKLHDNYLLVLRIGLSFLVVHPPCYEMSIQQWSLT